MLDKIIVLTGFGLMFSFPMLFIFGVYCLVIVVKVFGGILMQWNEDHLLPKEKEKSLEERLQIAFSKPIEIKDEWSEWDKKFAREYNERNGLG